MAPCLASTETSTTSLLARVTGATLYIRSTGLVGGIGGRYIPKAGKSARAVRTTETAGSKWEGGRPAVRDGGQADGDRENIF